MAGVPVEVVNAYEALFFNVTDKLHARDWVAIQAIGWWRFDPAKGRDKATVLKGYAYHGGPIVLDAVLPYLFGDKLEQEPVADASSPEGRLDRSIRLAVEIDTMPWDSGTTQLIFKAHLELLQDAREQAAGQRKDDALGRHVAETLALAAADAVKEEAGSRKKAGCRDRRRTA